MSILLLIFVVVVLLCIALYIIQIMPFPESPPWAKPVLQIICLIVAFIVIAERAGLMGRVLC